MKNKAVCLIILLSLFLGGCMKNQRLKYSSEWHNAPDGVWVGPRLWANRLQDWKVEDGRLVCVNSSPMRTVHLTSRRATDTKGNIKSSVTIMMSRGPSYSGTAAAGFLIGAGRGLDYRAASLIHNYSGKLAGLFVGLDASSNLFIRDCEKENEYLEYNGNNNTPWDKAYLIMTVAPGDNSHSLHVTAVNPQTNQVIDRLEADNIESGRIPGNIALVSHSDTPENRGISFSFEDWQVSGSKLDQKPEHIIGPIAGIQYTLSRSTLKINVQMMPLSEQENPTLYLDIKEDEIWKNIAEARIDSTSYTALFSISNWDKETDIPFRVRYKLKRKSAREFTENGIIQHDPVEKEDIIMLSLSGIQHMIRTDKNSRQGTDAGPFAWDRDLLYPHDQLTGNLERFDADILFFAGNQVYGELPEQADISREQCRLDYLYKWYLWCQTFKDLTSKIPSVIITGNHDVYQDNLWGAGGKAAPSGLSTKEAEDAGGYIMSPAFVNMVQATQTGHLPDPYDPTSTEQGIKVYYTDYNIGGLSLAILEDRKFKPAPGSMFPEANIVSGWPVNRDWNARRRSATDTTLLGERQLLFLEDWLADWSGGSWMKAVLSHTQLANMTTIPGDVINDDIIPVRELPDSGTTVNTDRMATDFDSNGWPQAGRDRAVSMFRKAFATHIAGGQPAGSTVQYGVDDRGDAGYALTTPAAGCIPTGRWFPPLAGRNREEGWPPVLGDFEDGFGNKIRVRAVANPHKSTIEPTELNQNSAGYSSIIFNRDTRDIEIANWPYYAAPGKGEPFPFWPLSFNQLDNYGKDALAWLPEIVCTGMDMPVIRVYRERTEELVYAIRIRGNTFQPGVFAWGSYRIETGDPDTDNWQVFEGVNATSFRQRETLEADFSRGTASVPYTTSQTGGN